MQLQTFSEDYLERLRAGDFRTQEHFIAYFGELIQLKLRSRLHSLEAIEDVKQETFVRVFASLRRKSIPSERLGAFVNSICNNILLEYYRATTSVLPEKDAAELPSDVLGIVESLAARQTEEKVQTILAELPERDRRLLLEVFFEEKDKDEVCRDFGVDRDYLRVLIHRAKQNFARLYKHGLSEGLHAQKQGASNQ